MVTTSENEPFIFRIKSALVGKNIHLIKNYKQKIDSYVKSGEKSKSEKGILKGQKLNFYLPNSSR